MTSFELLKRITARPDIFGGKPISRDMRLSVELILNRLVQGGTTEAILEDYPDLETVDIRACVAYAHAVIACDTLSALSVAERLNSSSTAARAVEWRDGRGRRSYRRSACERIRSGGYRR